LDTRETANRSHSRAGKVFTWLAILGVMAGLTAFYHALTLRGGGIVSSQDQDGRLMVTLAKARSGHFVAEGQINGHDVLFLVDTGATDVAISDKTARKMGIEFGPRITVMTAAGPATGWRTRLDRVSLGPLSLDNVRATITPGLGREALLGMSFLQYFNLRQEGDQLVLESRNNTE
jgi:aspartyl protease family protein